MLSVYAGFAFEGIDSWAFGLLFGFVSLVVGLMMMIYKDLETQVMKDRFLVILLSFGIVIVFWGAFEQAGGLMSIYTEQKTDRDFFGLFTIPATVFQGLNAGIYNTFCSSQLLTFGQKENLKARRLLHYLKWQ